MKKLKIKPVELFDQLESLHNTVEMIYLLKTIDYQQLATLTKFFGDH